MEYISKKNGRKYKLAEADITLKWNNRVTVQYFVGPYSNVEKPRRYAKKLKEGFVVEELSNGFPVVRRRTR